MAARLREDRLLSRATFGARLGDREALSAIGAERWVERELSSRTTASGNSTRDPLLRNRLKRFTSLGRSARELLAGAAPDDEPLMGARPGARPNKEQRREIMQLSRRIGREAAGARVVRAVHGENGLYEVMIDFWANHFSVNARKPLLGAVLPHYLDQTLVPHALGRFEDLLLATAQSPAMLIYLDNWNSTAPRTNPRRRRDRNRRRRGSGGINENYARELLELHTLGVYGGYDQRDVIEVANVFTGWSIKSRRDPSFRFDNALHVSGLKRVLGAQIREAGEAEGRRLIRQLAEHPSTATHISSKLVQRFVADTPPASLVTRASQRYLETGGEISAVLRVILLSPEFSEAENQKLKTPLRLLASALRATGGSTDGGPGVLRTLERMGEVPFGARSPAGYPETAREWINPGSLLARMNLAFALEGRRIPGTRLGRSQPQLGNTNRRQRSTARDARALMFASGDFQWS